MLLDKKKEWKVGCIVFIGHRDCSCAVEFYACKPCRLTVST